MSDAKKADEVVTRILGSEGRKILKGTHIMNILEFSRVIHAEMAAITEAGRRGFSLAGSVLYSTTFPCHMCARHIISSGIRRVVYIEPYPKSLAGELYDDSIVIDQEDASSEYVHFDAFVGISPRRYMEFFSADGKRKDEEGKVLNWDPVNSVPKFKRYMLTYLQIEGEILVFLPEKCSEVGLSLES